MSLTYPGRHLPALLSVSLTVQPGERVGVCGRTGAGKSSLLNAVFQLAALHSGAICVGGVDLAHMSSRCAFLGTGLSQIVVYASTAHGAWLEPLHSTCAG